MKLVSVNPFNQRVVHERAQDDVQSVNEKLNDIELQYRSFRLTGIEDRKEILKKIALNFSTQKEELAQLITLETGKKIIESRAEIDKCIWAFNYYATNGKHFFSTDFFKTGASNAEIRLQSIGPILAVMPWNFPFWQVVRVLAPAILAGNVLALKHASNVSLCAEAIENIVLKTNPNAIILKTIYVSSSRIEELVSHSAIKAVTLTGSENAGKSIAGIAAKYLKKTVLELGGSDPFIIAEHCNLDKAFQAAFDARMINTGQSCIAAKRFFVHEFHRNRFIDFITKQIQQLKCSDPMDESCNYAPLSSQAAVEDFNRLIESSLQEGGNLIYKKPSIECQKGFAAPLIIESSDQNNTVMREETFGPCFAVTFFKKFEDAVFQANLSRFGLGATLFSDNMKEQHFFKENIQSGMAFINDFTKSKPYLPFGGIKQSGYGRELNIFGMLEFMNIKAIEQFES